MGLKLTIGNASTPNKNVFLTNLFTIGRFNTVVHQDITILYSDKIVNLFFLFR
jgi:hypothetical protein